MSGRVVQHHACYVKNKNYCILQTVSVISSVGTDFGVNEFRPRALNGRHTRPRVKLTGCHGHACSLLPTPRQRKLI